MPPRRKAPLTSPTISDAQTLPAPRESSPASNQEDAQPVFLTGTPHQRLLDAVVTRVLSKLDVEGLSRDITSKLAEQLLQRVQVEGLVTQILEGQMEALTARLTELLIARLLGFDQ
jgi:hypothetical protein